MASLMSLLLLLLFLTAPSLAQSSKDVSITSNLGYKEQKGCVKTCLYYGVLLVTSRDVLGAINCEYPWLNDCLCRADQAPPATSFLSRCVSSNCDASGTEDFTRAVSVYDAYCRSAGYIHDGAAKSTAAITTAAIVDPNAPTVTKVSVVTETGKTSGAGILTLGLTTSLKTNLSQWATGLMAMVGVAVTTVCIGLESACCYFFQASNSQHHVYRAGLRTYAYQRAHGLKSL
ncbi:hypothetical protein BCR34DRAFT_620657 [Clohesyomyces aquaticus]|uniref:Extracellular membrane protein CFEM domain-containing protein n=1 Tax=Clohesyomyces aquaticus TaxID=1231657 RepID=A0A1Y1XZ60_9PLEO|nr:hypothetical protein BCR34DRAFT_620657 [Clohesyomyces aquaticus]